jgi:CRISP-associated protein Cas1
MDRIVDIATDGLHLSALRGFLLVSQDREEVGRIALDDVSALIVHAHGVTWTTNLVVQLAERGAIMVLCAANHMPVALTVPISGHYAQNARMRAQWDAPRPLFKQLWKSIVIAKIKMQASLLAAHAHAEANALAAIAGRVRSGDPDNLEAQAARRYWQTLFGAQFRRDRAEEGINALLNYGYTVMRATLARAVVAAGLNPTIGLHHANRSNSFALVDDLIEPFRPLVDGVVWQIVDEALHTGQTIEVNSGTKQRLAALIAADLDLQGATSPVSVAAQRLAQSLAASFAANAAALALFETPSPLNWSIISRHVPDGAIR